MFSLLSGMYVYLFGIPQYNVLVLGLDGSGKSTFLYQVGTICDRKRKKQNLKKKKSPPPIPTLKHKISDDPNSPSKLSECKSNSNDDVYFKYPNLRHILPTMGQNVKIMEFDNMNLQFWDLPGQTGFRKIWTHYFNEVHGIVFMVDSADTERLNEARNELHKLLKNPQLKYAPILILANKQDLKQAVDYQSIIETLQIMTTVSSRKISDKLPPIDEFNQKLNKQTKSLFSDRSLKVMCTCCLNKDGLLDAISWLVYTIPLANKRLEYVAKQNSAK